MKHAGIFDGEEYDAREPMGYECVEKLSTPEENTEFSGDILPSDGAEVYLRTDLALAPVKAYKSLGSSGILIPVGLATISETLASLPSCFIKALNSLAAFPDNVEKDALIEILDFATARNY